MHASPQLSNLRDCRTHRLHYLSKVTKLIKCNLQRIKNYIKFPVKVEDVGTSSSTTLSSTRGSSTVTFSETLRLQKLLHPLQVPLQEQVEAQRLSWRRSFGCGCGCLLWHYSLL